MGNNRTNNYNVYDTNSTVQKGNIKYDDMHKQNKDFYNKEFKKDVNRLTKMAEDEEKGVKHLYQKAYDDNAVSAELSKRQVKESMGYNGLRDTGLNRMQQTGISVHQMNNRSSIMQNQTKAVASIKSQLSSAIYDLKKTLNSNINNSRVNTQQAKLNLWQQNAGTADANKNEMLTQIATATDSKAAAQFIKLYNQMYNLSPAALKNLIGLSVISQKDYNKYLNNPKYFDKK